MKTKSFITTSMARMAMTLLIFLLGSASLHAYFINDVMLIGGNKDEVDTLKANYQKQGWNVIDKDLNEGCGSKSDYIYLLYKEVSSFYIHNHTFITDFYISNTKDTAPDTYVHNGHTYYLVPYDGGEHFMNLKGDLNSNAKGDHIHLYYTKENVSGSLKYPAISKITFDDNSTGAVGVNGGSEGYDLNKGSGSGSAYIYMHRSRWDSNEWKIQYSEDGKQCQIIGFEGQSEGSYGAIPAIIAGAPVTNISNLNIKEYTRLETLYLSEASVLSEMLNFEQRTRFTHIHIVDIKGNIIRYDELPASIISVPRYSLTYTNIKKLSMPQVKTIGWGAFGPCRELTSISFGDSINYIEQEAFFGCEKLNKVNISNLAGWCNVYFGDTRSNPLQYGHNLYLNDNLVKDLVIPKKVNSISTYAFYGCTSISSVTFPPNVTYVGRSAFQDCDSLKKVIISDIAAWCNIKWDDRASNPLVYGHNLYFNNNKITDLIIPSGVTTIKDLAFYCCTSLNSVTIPNSMTNIGNEVFRSCTSLEDIYFEGTETQWKDVTKGTDWRRDVPSSCKEHWRCTVDFNSNGYGTTPASQTNLWSNESKVTEPTAPSLWGYAFTGWYTDADCTNKWNFETPVPRDMTLYAGWERLVDIADNSNNHFGGFDKRIKSRVTLKGRTLYKDGSWNTLCLPFSISSLAGTPLEGATVMELDVTNTYDGKQTGFDTNANILHLYFKGTQSITAGIPYLIKWDAGNTADITNPVFYERTIINERPDTIKSSDGLVSFVGFYSPVSLAKDDKTVLYLDADNILSYPNTDMNINSCRASFRLVNELPNHDLGDVNGDKAISIADVMMLVNDIIGNVNANFIAENADINGDQQISVADVMALVGIVIGGNSDTFKLVTNLDDTPINYGGGGSGPAKVKGF